MYFPQAITNKETIIDVHTVYPPTLYEQLPLNFRNILNLSVLNVCQINAHLLLY